jgi:hypothetical protein
MLAAASSAWDAEGGRTFRSGSMRPGAAGRVVHPSAQTSDGTP